MVRTREPCIYALTYQDVQRIRAILSTVDDAVAELINYRRIDTTGPRADFPCESAFYVEACSITRDVMDQDILF